MRGILLLLLVVVVVVVGWGADDDDADIGAEADVMGWERGTDDCGGA